MKNLSFKLLVGLASMILLSVSSFAQPLSATVTTTSSCGPSGGTATVTPTGGTGTYTYIHWYPSNLSTNTILNQPAGSGVVTVFDGVDSFFAPYNIAASPAAAVTVAALRDTFCRASLDTLTATANGPGATYVWNSGTLSSGTSTDNPLSVSAALVNSGSYTFTVTSTDANGCTATATKTLVTYDVTAGINTINQPTCGHNNGSIQVNIQYGSSYIAQFFQGSTLIQSGTGLTQGSLLPGTYSFTVMDPATGCQASVNPIVLTDNTTPPVFGTPTITPEQCFGDNNGAATVTVANCTGSCVLTWSNDPTNHTTSASALAAGTYYVSASGNGCNNIIDTVVIPGPASRVNIDTIRITPDHCDRHVGTGRAVISGGTGPYTYVWSQGNALAAFPDSVVNLQGDSSVTLYLTDSHGCADTVTRPIGNTPGPSARITNTDTICSTEHNGVLIVEATSNDGPFTYRWSNGSTTTVAGGLSTGQYAVTVTNAVGCDTVLRPRVEGYNASLRILSSTSTTQGRTVLLTAYTNVPVRDVHWTPYIDGSSGSVQAYATPQENTQYSVIVTYGEDCHLYDTTFVAVNEDSSKMIVANTFTPNGDGINDNFSLIAYPNDIIHFQIWIYDRWGNKVYESTDVNFNWDGSDVYAANKPLNTGVFSYAVEYTLYRDHEKKAIGGNISLVK